MTLNNMVTRIFTTFHVKSVLCPIDRSCINKLIQILGVPLGFCIIMSLRT